MTEPCPDCGFTGPYDDHACEDTWAAQVQLCNEFLCAAEVDETFGVEDIRAKREALLAVLNAPDWPGDA